jgi:hypothetical protein
MDFLEPGKLDIRRSLRKPVRFFGVQYVLQIIAYIVRGERWVQEAVQSTAG